MFPSSIVSIITDINLQAIYGSAETEKKASTGGVISKIAKEPVLIVPLIYNPVQVALCGTSFTFLTVSRFCCMACLKKCCICVDAIRLQAT